VPKINRTDFANQKFVYNFYSIHFFVGSFLIIAIPSEKKGTKHPQGPKLEALMVRRSTFSSPAPSSLREDTKLTVYPSRRGEDAGRGVTGSTKVTH
jgi:hypothetical protein